VSLTNRDELLFQSYLNVEKKLELLGVCVCLCVVYVCVLCCVCVCECVCVDSYLNSSNRVVSILF